MRRMGITDEDLDMINDEMMSAFGGAESLPAHQVVQLTGPGPVGEVDAVAVQVFPLGRLIGLALLRLMASACAVAGGRGRRLVAAAAAAAEEAGLSGEK